ncbi:MAG: hypothetical protein J7K66_01220 [Anaerolineaceae bacterium]|nr:hypothetical protein [Anaerolineaceae bacterium]
MKKKGDITKFNIKWKARNGFSRQNDFWSTDINHSTRIMKASVIFPKERPPLKCITVESNRQKIKELPNNALIR